MYVHMWRNILYIYNKIEINITRTMLNSDNLGK